MDIVGGVMQQLSGDAVSQIGRRIGADEATTRSAIGAALPMLVSALARNASRPGGAEALHQALERDHDGSILDDLMGSLGGGHAASGAGGAILGHILGGQRGALQGGLAQSLGLGAGSVGTLLEILAPLVMGALGRARQQGGLDAGSLGGYLGQQRQQAAEAAPDLMGMLGGLLDSDGDGSVVDDLAGLAGSFLGRGR
jgi:hypothetical protein